MSTVMVAPGGWRVEQITVDGFTELRVTRGGILTGGLPGGRFKDRGVHFTSEAVAATMGPDFALLVEATSK